MELLLKDELEVLLDALRRDMRTQSILALSGTPLAEWHGFNARRVKRILEAINPKFQNPDAHPSTCRLGSVRSQALPSRGFSESQAIQGVGVRIYSGHRNAHEPEDTTEDFDYLVGRQR